MKWGNWLARVEALIRKLPAKLRKRQIEKLTRIVESGARSSDDLAALLLKRGVGNDVRGCCAWTLGIIGDKRAIPALTSALRTHDKGLVWECALAIAKIGGPEAESQLLKALRRSGNSERRTATIAALGNMRSMKGVRYLLKILASRRLSPRIRGEAAESLGKIGSKAAFNHLLDATYDKSTEVRFWAVHSLGQMGERRALQRLTDLAREDHARLKHWGPVSREAKDAAKQIVLICDGARARRTARTRPSPTPTTRWATG